MISQELRNRNEAMETGANLTPPAPQIRVYHQHIVHKKSRQNRFPLKSCVRDGP